MRPSGQQKASMIIRKIEHGWCEQIKALDDFKLAEMRSIITHY
jgi:hypothetical protein